MKNDSGKKIEDGGSFRCAEGHQHQVLVVDGKIFISKPSEEEVLYEDIPSMARARVGGGNPLYNRNYDTIDWN